MEFKQKNVGQEMMHISSRIPFDPRMGIRPNKVRILEGLGFSKGSNVARIRDFKIEDFTVFEEMIQYLENELNENRTVSILFMREAFTNLGGSPIIYCNSVQDLRDNFLNNELGIFGMTQSGEALPLISDMKVKTFSREKGLLCRLDNLEGPKTSDDVNLGGGFRMQLDGVNFHEDSISFDWDCAFSFNGFGPRVLTFDSEKDYQVPSTRMKIRLIYKDGALSLENDNVQSISNAVETRDAHEILKTLLVHLLDTEGTQLLKLLRLLLAAKPELQLHSLAGVYIANSSGLSTEVIDFDGVDTLDGFSEGIDSRRVLTQKLLGSQLQIEKFIDDDPESLRTFTTYFKEIRDKLEFLNAQGILTDEMIKIIENHFIMDHSNYSLFTSELTGEVKLARLLSNLNLEWEEIDTSGIFILRRKEDVFIKVDINGFKIAFWIHNGEITPTEKIENMIPDLSETLGKDIYRVHYSNLREGD